MSLATKQEFIKGLSTLGFDQEEDCLFLCDQETSDPEIKFYLEDGKMFGATAIFFRKQLTKFKPQVYLYDFTGFTIEENILTGIQKKIWTSGTVPLVCIFYDTEIKILDCTTHIGKDSAPVYLKKTLEIASVTDELYNQLFAVKIKTGLFWEEETLKNKFKFTNSAYDILIRWIKKINEQLSGNYNSNPAIINKIIIQSILIKYLEERQDGNGGKLFSAKYFQNFSKAKNFSDVLRTQGKFVNLLEKLHKDFNGNLFLWPDDEKEIVKNINLNVLANALEGKSDSDGQSVIDFFRYYEFNFIPVELISRLYEEFLAGTSSKPSSKEELSQKEKKQKEGIFYTPAHLATLLVDEAMPIKNYADVDLSQYKVLDPACGSGIFLVLAFKRLVQWWRLQNDMQRPDVEDLKLLIRCVYGIDKEPQATQLAAFSLCLALCDELSPLQIISKLRFDDLTLSNTLFTDYFISELSKPLNATELKSYDIQTTNFQKIADIQFDLIIGNPPFDRGALKHYNNKWTWHDKTVEIPQGQLALKFLTSSLLKLKPNGLQCLIIKSSGLLYNSTSSEFKKLLFSNLNVLQILDFTPLARNKSLWDGADVAAAAIFIRNQQPDFEKSILHLTFRRTKATKDRVIFEIDDYDFHFVNRRDAIEVPYVWKANLLGGGRVKDMIHYYNLKYPLLETYLKKENCIIEEGFEFGSKDKHSPAYIYDLPFLPTEGITENEIIYDSLTHIDKSRKLTKVSSESLFQAPNIIIWESIGAKRFPVFLNLTSFSFQRRIIGIKSLDNNVNLLNSIVKSFETHYSTYKSYFLISSGETLINRNNTFLLKDLKKMPFIHNGGGKKNSIFSKIAIDINKYFEDFFIHGETSIAVKPIKEKDIKPLIENFGKELSNTLNKIYDQEKKNFSLTDVMTLNNSSFIATVFKYSNKEADPQYHNDNSKLKLKALTQKSLSTYLSSKRIIRIYEKDTIIIIKPNQNRYWLSLAAYRDADKCFADLSTAGY